MNQCFPEPGLGPARPAGLGTYFKPAPDRASLRHISCGPAPGVAYVPDELSSRAPCGAFAPVKYSSPAPGEVRAPAAPNKNVILKKGIMRPSL